jgi:hypothetical protein
MAAIYSRKKNVEKYNNLLQLIDSYQFFVESSS